MLNITLTKDIKMRVAAASDTYFRLKNNDYHCRYDPNFKRILLQ